MDFTERIQARRALLADEISKVKGQLVQIEADLQERRTRISRMEGGILEFDYMLQQIRDEAEAAVSPLLVREDDYRLSDLAPLSPEAEPTEEGKKK